LQDATTVPLPYICAQGAGELPHNTIAPTLEDATRGCSIFLVVLSFSFICFKKIVFEKEKKIVAFPTYKKNILKKQDFQDDRVGRSQICVRNVARAAIDYPEVGLGGLRTP